MRKEPVISQRQLRGQQRNESPWSVIEILPSEAQIQTTQQIMKKSLESSQGLRGSITKGKGSFLGTLGEVVTAHFFKLPLVNNGDKWDPHFDLMHPQLKKVDVKTKRQSGTTVYSGYEISVWDQSRERQQCDYYLFNRIRLTLAEEKAEDFTKCIVWILGICPKTKYFKIAQFVPKGSVDSKNGFVAKDDCWNLPIYMLESLPGVKIPEPVAREPIGDIWNFG